MISNKFWCDTSMMYPGTNFVYIAKKLKHIVEFYPVTFTFSRMPLLASELPVAGILYEK